MEQLTRLDENRVQASDDPKTEALRRAEAAIADLQALGLSYGLTQRRSSTPRGKKKKLVAEGQQEFSFS